MIDAHDFLRQKEREAYQLFRQTAEDPNSSAKDRMRCKYEWYVVADLLDEYENIERSELYV